jgi:hypothetical protein
MEGISNANAAQGRLIAASCLKPDQTFTQLQLAGGSRPLPNAKRDTPFDVSLLALGVLIDTISKM